MKYVFILRITKYIILGIAIMYHIYHLLYFSQHDKQICICDFALMFAKMCLLGMKSHKCIHLFYK